MLSFRAVFKVLAGGALAVLLSGCATVSQPKEDKKGASENTLPPLKTHLTLTERQAMAMDLAALYLRYGELEKARTLLMVLRRAIPLHPRLLRLLAQYYIKAGDTDMAMKVLRLMVEKKQATEQDEDLLARLALQKGQTALAQKIFKKWTEQCKGMACARAWNNYGWSLYVAGDLKAATQAFEQALKLDPLDEKALNNLKKVQAAVQHAAGKEVKHVGTE